VRNVPAALFKALGGFATNGVNMTKLESYMVDGEFAATRFLADVDGHPRATCAFAGAGGAGISFLAKSKFWESTGEPIRETNIRAFEFGD